MATAFCLDCGYAVNLGSQPVEDQVITCSNCGAQLEVISLDPLELDWAYLKPVVDAKEWDWGEEWGKGWGKESHL